MANMSEAERLSLQASSVIAEAMDVEVAATGCSYEEAAERVLRREAHLAAGLAGDVATFATLSARARVTRMAALPGGTERRFRRAGPPRALSRRPIRDRSELRPGEVLCAHLTAAPGEPALFAEVLG